MPGGMPSLPIMGGSMSGMLGVELSPPQTDADKKRVNELQERRYGRR